MAPCNHCQLANQSRREPLRGLSQSKRNLRTTANRMSAFSKHIWLHHECHFGRANQLPTVKANHSLVLLEAPEIVDENSLHVGHGTSYEEWIACNRVCKRARSRCAVPVPSHDNCIFLHAEEQSGSIVLFSHIPLHRTESKLCGPLQERSLRRMIRWIPSWCRAWLAKDAWEADVRIPPRESASHDCLQVSLTYSTYMHAC